MTKSELLRRRCLWRRSAMVERLEYRKTFEDWRYKPSVGVVDDQEPRRSKARSKRVASPSRRSAGVVGRRVPLGDSVVFVSFADKQATSELIVCVPGIWLSRHSEARTPEFGFAQARPGAVFRYAAGRGWISRFQEAIRDGRRCVGCAKPLDPKGFRAVSSFKTRIRLTLTDASSPRASCPAAS